MGQVAGRRMTGFAVSLSIEVFTASRRIPNQQLFERVLGRNALRYGTGDLRLGVKKLRDVTYLRIGKLKRRHAFFRSPVANNLPDQIPAHVVADQRGANQVGTAISSRIQSVTEPAGLLELRFPCGNARRLRLLRPDIIRVLGKQQ